MDEKSNLFVQEAAQRPRRMTVADCRDLVALAYGEQSQSNPIYDTQTSKYSANGSNETFSQAALN